ncbi:carboxylating nicotinate-nucleotide diphosphorylase [Halocatena halophila]|uniref:carboxylating nicotinate-nucleotide diphosphorylase n=1 Tax=Halocatena halophila TaxID=2814576 RepID=UPI002ED14864
MLIERRQIEAWLAEDLGHHDVTNAVPGTTTAQLVAKDDGVVAGIDVASAVFSVLDAEITVEPAVSDGEQVATGDVLLTARGPAKSLLRGERVVVNAIGHACGVATRTHRAVTAAREISESVAIAGTRKTTPGLRRLEKRAIVAGGGDTHRLDLSHMVMVKDNHIAEMGLETAIETMRDRASFTTKIEVEVESPSDGPRAAAAGADIVLFDNMTPDDVARGVEKLPANVLSEASGGITIETVPEYAATGVDVISMGSLTHSASALDLSFRTGE